MTRRTLFYSHEVDRLIDIDAIWSSIAPLGPVVGADWVDTSDLSKILVKYWSGAVWIAWALLSRKDDTDSSDSPYGPTTITDNNDGTITITTSEAGLVVDNADGTRSVSSSIGTITDLNDGRLVIDNVIAVFEVPVNDLESVLISSVLLDTDSTPFYDLTNTTSPRFNIFLDVDAAPYIEV